MQREIIVKSGGMLEVAKTDITLVPGDVHSYRIVLKTPHDLTGGSFKIAAKLDNETVITDMGTVEGDTAYYTLKNSMYSVGRETRVRLTLFGVTGETLTDKELIFTVADDWGEGGVTADDRLPVLNSLIIQVSEALDGVNNAKGEIQSHIRNDDIHITESNIAAFNNLAETVNTHKSKPELDHPNNSILAKHIASNSVTDEKIGNRTILNPDGASSGNVTSSLTSLLSRISSAINTIRNSIGSLVNLKTTDKSNLVSAINETLVKAETSGVRNLVDGNNTGAVRGINTKTDYTMGTNAFAEGRNTSSSGNYSHAEGDSAKATGSAAHAEGSYTNATGGNSHAEGGNTTASGLNSHAEGSNSNASAKESHAEGFYTTASGDFSHAGGRYTTAKYNQTVIGRSNKISDASDTVYDRTKEAFIIGNGTGTSTNDRSNAFAVRFNGDVDLYGDISVMDETKLNTTAKTIIGAINEAAESGGGLQNLVDGATEGSVKNADASVTPGIRSFSFGGSGNLSAQAGGKHAVAFGETTWANGASSFVHGQGSSASGLCSFSMGRTCNAMGEYSTAFGRTTSANGACSFVHGQDSHANGAYSFAFGLAVSANGNASFAGGNYAYTNGTCSFCYGDDVVATSSYATCFGSDNTAAGYSTFVAGYDNYASGYASSAFGEENDVYSEAGFVTGYANKIEVYGTNSFAAGFGCLVEHANSAVFGSMLRTTNKNSLVTGIYNSVTDVSGQAFAIGNGTGPTSRSNAFAVYFNGNIDLHGDITVKTPDLLQTESQTIIGAINELASKETGGIEFAGERIFAPTFWNIDPETGGYVMDNEGEYMLCQGKENTLYFRYMGAPQPAPGARTIIDGGNFGDVQTGTIDLGAFNEEQTGTLGGGEF